MVGDLDVGKLRSVEMLDVLSSVGHGDRKLKIPLNSIDPNPNLVRFCAQREPERGKACLVDVARCKKN